MRALTSGRRSSDAMFRCSFAFLNLLLPPSFAFCLTHVVSLSCSFLRTTSRSICPGNFCDFAFVVEDGEDEAEGRRWQQEDERPPRRLGFAPIPRDAEEAQGGPHLLDPQRQYQHNGEEEDGHRCSAFSGSASTGREDRTGQRRPRGPRRWQGPAGAGAARALSVSAAIAGGRLLPAERRSRSSDRTGFGCWHCGRYRFRRRRPFFQRRRTVQPNFLCSCCQRFQQR